MSKEDALFHVWFQRKNQPAVITLNFTQRENANNAFSKLTAATAKTDGRQLLQDDFGSKLWVDPDDIGPVVFVEAEGTLKLNQIQSLMAARNQVRANQIAEADPLISGKGRIQLATGGITGMPRA